MQIDASIHSRLTALVEEGIREGRIHPEGSAEALDARDAEVALDSGRLLAAARCVSGLVRSSAWDEIRELAWEAGAPADVFSWDDMPAVAAPERVESRW